MKLQIAMIAVVLVGGVGIFVLLQQDDDDDRGDSGGSTKIKTKTKPAKAKKGKARLDEILDDKAAKSGGTNRTATRAPIPTTPPSGGLPTWTPGSVDSGTEDDTDSFGPTDTDSSWDTWEKEWPSDADTLILEED